MPSLTKRKRVAMLGAVVTLSVWLVVGVGPALLARHRINEAAADAGRRTDARLAAVDVAVEVVSRLEQGVAFEEIVADITGRDAAVHLAPEVTIRRYMTKERFSRDPLVAIEVDSAEPRWAAVIGGAGGFRLAELPTSRLRAWLVRSHGGS